MAHTHNTSRRNFLAGAAAVASTGALAALPIEAATVIRPEWIALGTELEAASDAYYDALLQERAAESQMASWLDANPCPMLGEWPDGDRAAEKATVEVYEAALRERGVRKIAEMRRCRLAPTKAETNVALARHKDSCLKIVNLEATTMDELIWKAQMTEHENAEGWISNSIADDLLTIGAGL